MPEGSNPACPKGANSRAFSNGKGKENLFKCLPEKGVEAEWYWENETSRMLMLHRLSDGADGVAQEKYYLHIEPK